MTSTRPCCSFATGDTGHSRGASLADPASSEGLPLVTTHLSDTPAGVDSASRLTLPPWAVRSITSGATQAARCASRSA